MSDKHIIMDSKAIQRALMRISYEIIERNKGTEAIGVIGILSRGVSLGRRIAYKLSELEQTNIPFGSLDITSFRDDLLPERHEDMTDIPFSVQNRRIILVDDVLFTGRSVRAAIDAVMSRGRPQSIQLAVLVDRGHRELPIRPDYVGKNLPTSHSEMVEVSVTELDGEDQVCIIGTDSSS
ncbi:MAG: bifunctional pyr operon transcriptional regulator/uracil phosphoribosyltransferase PyrR [Ruminococcus sp.]|nr:bifunctional pyr operon transcriptional regulator/uracil phosphoribosyltransferase PyrR [Ruminococcus sp.]